jgi:hypothetical protein
LRPSRYLYILFFIFSFCISFSQAVRVDAILDTSKMRIGEQVKVDLYLSYDAKLKNLEVHWPSVGDTLTGKVEVVSVSAIDTTFPNKTNSSRVFQHQQILVSVYDSGFFAIPPFKFVVDNNQLDSLYTNPLFLEVHTVPTDTSATKIKDIKQPFDEKFNWKWYLKYIYWALGIIAAVLLIVFLTLYFNRKNRKVFIEPEKPKVPAHITALAELEKIKQEAVWKEGRAKEYYSQISDTVRLYIEDRFGLNALESTTDEIMKAFRTQVVDKESKDKLQQLLTLSDLVKFAKMTPIEHEHEFTLQHAFDFVNGTKREEVVTLPEEPANNNTPAS